MEILILNKKFIIYLCQTTSSFSGSFFFFLCDFLDFFWFFLFLFLIVFNFNIIHTKIFIFLESPGPELDRNPLIWIRTIRVRYKGMGNRIDKNKSKRFGTFSHLIQISQDTLNSCSIFRITIVKRIVFI